MALVITRSLLVFLLYVLITHRFSISEFNYSAICTCNHQFGTHNTFLVWLHGERGERSAKKSEKSVISRDPAQETFAFWSEF